MVWMCLLGKRSSKASYHNIINDDAIYSTTDPASIVYKPIPTNSSLLSQRMMDGGDVVSWIW